MSEFKIGDRVRIVKGTSFPSRIHKGEIGEVVPRPTRLSGDETQEYRAAFPVAVLLESISYPIVWSFDELEHIE